MYALQGIREEGNEAKNELSFLKQFVLLQHLLLHTLCRYSTLPCTSIAPKQTKAILKLWVCSHYSPQKAAALHRAFVFYDAHGCTKEPIRGFISWKLTNLVRFLSTEPIPLPGCRSTSGKGKVRR